MSSDTSDIFSLQNSKFFKNGPFLITVVHREYKLGQVSSKRDVKDEMESFGQPRYLLAQTQMSRLTLEKNINMALLSPSAFDCNFTV